MTDSACRAYTSSDAELNAELFHSSGDCIKVLDLEGKLSRLNPGGVVALELDGPTQLIGKEWWSMWPVESKPHAEAAFNFAKNGGIQQFQAFCPTALGTPRWWDVIASPIYDASGTVKKVMIVSRDITALAEAREALSEANRLKDDLLATVAHELRNPISAALTTTHLLKLKEFDHARTSEYASVIQRQLAHVSRIAEDLLDASRIGRGELYLDKKLASMKTVVAEALEQLQTAHTAKNQLVSVKMSADNCTVMGDFTRLVQIIGNLLANAIRYTPENGVIQLALSRTSSKVEFTVTDTGIGISAEKLEWIFDLYAQGSKESERKSGGLGLGLSLVKSLVIAHGGTVQVSSKGTNLGSQFSVKLPAVE